MTPPLRFRSALEVPLTELATALSAGFEGYFRPVPDDPVAMAMRIRQEQMDLSTSWVATIDENVVGLVLVSRRGSRSRVALMGVAAPWRGQGIGRAMMERVLAEAKERRDRAVWLEVIEQNEPAVRLYQQQGFQILRKLRGYTADTLPAEAAPLERIEIEEVAREVARGGDESLPWQLQASMLASMTAPVQAFRWGEAFALVSQPAEILQLRTVFVRPEGRRQGQGRRMVRAIAHHFAGRSFAVLPIIPEDFDAFLLSCGFQHGPIAHLEMVCPLRGAH